MRPIDADSVKRGIEELKQSPWYNEKNLDHFPIRKEAVEIVEHLCIDKEPTIDAVPVVRCKDCKLYWKNHNDWVITLDCVMSRNDDGFCHRGERKDDEPE